MSEINNILTNLIYSMELDGGEDRLKELIIYIASKCQDDPLCNVTKLNKILFHSDFRAFAELGKPITGTNYQAIQGGPAPKRLAPIRDKMISQGDLLLQKRQTPTGYQHRYYPNRDADLSHFTPQEIALIDSVIEESRHKTATQMSDESHGVIWRTTAQGSEIPYQASYLSDRPLTTEDHFRAEQIAQEYSL